MTRMGVELGAQRRRLRHPHEGRVNVLPLVNLFLMLIPFLLLCASFAPLAAAPLTLEAPAAPSHGRVMVTVAIRPTLFHIETRGAEGMAGAAHGINVPRTMDDAEGAAHTYGQLV